MKRSPSFSVSRRSLVKAAGLAALATPFLQIINLGKLFAQEAKKLIDITGKKRKDPQNKAAVAIAKGFNYIENAKTEKHVGGSEQTSAKGTKFPAANQFCKNCQYAPEAQKQKDGYSCLLIANVLVHNEGWCNKWMPRQDA